MYVIAILKKICREKGIVFVFRNIQNMGSWDNQSYNIESFTFVHSSEREENSARSHSHSLMIHLGL